MPMTVSAVRAVIKMRSIRVSRGDSPPSRATGVALEGDSPRGDVARKGDSPRGAQFVEGPARARARGEVFALPGGKAVVARERDHRGIVGAKLRAREEGACAGRGELARQHRAQPPVRADAAGDNE